MTQSACVYGCKQHSGSRGWGNGPEAAAVRQSRQREWFAGDSRAREGGAGVRGRAAGQLRIQQAEQKCLPPVLHTVRQEGPFHKMVPFIWLQNACFPQVCFVSDTFSPLF